MNRHLSHATNSNTVQAPVSFKSAKKTLNRGSPIVDSSPFVGLSEQRTLMTWIYFDNWLSPVLTFNKVSQLIATIASVTNNIPRMKSAIGISCFTKTATSNGSIVSRASGKLSSYGKFILSVR